MTSSLVSSCQTCFFSPAHPPTPSIFPSGKTFQIPQCLFTLVNLARLSLAGSRLGPAQGSQLEEKLRLDTLTINPNAVLPPKATSDHQQQQQPQHVETPNGPAARGRRINAKGLTQISTSVPAGRLSELREQVHLG